MGDPTLSERLGPLLEEARSFELRYHNLRVRHDALCDAAQGAFTLLGKLKVELRNRGPLGALGPEVERVMDELSSRAQG